MGSRRSHALLALASLLAASPRGARAETLCHPVAQAGGPYSAECTGPTASIQLDGSGSFTCPGDTLTYSWTTDCPGGVIDLPTTVAPTLTLQSPPPCPVACTVVLVVTNGIGQQDDSTAAVTVSDTMPPSVTAQPAPLACLTPPDHRFVCFRPQDLEADAADVCGEATLRFTECASSEPDDAPGGSDGHTTGDCQVAPDGLTLCARAERDARGGGRDYTVSAIASDACGNTAAPAVIGVLRVPRRPGAACSAASLR